MFQSYGPLIYGLLGGFSIVVATYFKENEELNVLLKDVMYSATIIWAILCSALGSLAWCANNCGWEKRVDNLLSGGSLNKGEAQLWDPSDPLCLFFMAVFLAWLLGVAVCTVEEGGKFTNAMQGTWDVKKVCDFVDFCVHSLNAFLIVFTLCLLSVFYPGVSVFTTLLMSFVYVVLTRIWLICLAHRLGLVQANCRLCNIKPYFECVFPLLCLQLLFLPFLCIIMRRFLVAHGFPAIFASAHLGIALLATIVGALIMYTY